MPKQWAIYLKRRSQNLRKTANEAPLRQIPFWSLWMRCYGVLWIYKHRAWWLLCNKRLNWMFFSSAVVKHALKSQGRSSYNYFVPCCQRSIKKPEWKVLYHSSLLLWLDWQGDYTMIFAFCKYKTRTSLIQGMEWCPSSMKEDTQDLFLQTTYQ